MKRGAFIDAAWAVTATAACTAAGIAMTPRFDLVNVAMVYLAAVVVIALHRSRGAAILASVLSVATFDFLFVPPQGTFTVHDGQYLLTFGIMLGVALVISRLTEATRRQARAQAALEIEAESERIRSLMLASLSHDLRTPLAVIAGASSTLATRGESMDAEGRRELAGNIFLRATEVSEHLSKVLQMTRLEMGGVRADRDWASLAEICGSVLARLAERLRDHPVSVELPGDLPLVRLDAGLIEQVLANLLENAARHTPPGTVVRLRATAGEREVMVSVEDFGAGLPDGELARVFEKFHRGAAEKGQGGIGLGLAICRAVVALHGGRVWAERVPGGGTAFRFTLPLEEPPSIPIEAAAP